MTDSLSPLPNRHQLVQFSSLSMWPRPNGRRGNLGRYVGWSLQSARRNPTNDYSGSEASVILPLDIESAFDSAVYTSHPPGCFGPSSRTCMSMKSCLTANGYR